MNDSGGVTYPQSASLDLDSISQNPLGGHMNSTPPANNDNHLDSTSQNSPEGHLTPHLTLRSYQRSRSPEY